MGLPYLRIPPEEALSIIDRCIVSGYEVKDKITAEYPENTVSSEQIKRWRDMALDWARKCINELEKAFVSKKELYNFRDAPASPLFKVGHNEEWNGIINKIQARVNKLNEYDRYIRQEFSVKIEVVGRDKIVQKGSKGKIEIKN